MSKLGKLGSVSLLLSLGFYVWWLIWPAFSLYGSQILQRLFLGLPLWFWLSSIFSLPLLFFAALGLLWREHRK